MGPHSRVAGRLRAARCGFALGVVMSALAFASQPPAATPATPPGTGDRGGEAPAAATPTPTPNDEFIEFLGADDVGDAAWWDFLKNSAPHRDRQSVPQDAGQ